VIGEFGAVSILCCNSIFKLNRWGDMYFSGFTAVKNLRVSPNIYSLRRVLDDALVVLLKSP
jgi:hypothetical protein